MAVTSGPLSYNAAMRLGLALPNATPDGRPLTGPALIAGARAVERAGFDSLWCFDSVGVDFETRMQQFEEALAVMRRLWRGEKVGEAKLDPWPAAVGGPKLLIGSWAGSRWIPRAAKDFDGWIGSGARSSVAALRDGIKRFREAGGTRAIATNIPVDLEAPTAPMPDEGQFHLRCEPKTAAERLRMLADLGFDDAVLVTRRHGDADLAALRALLK